MFFDEPWVRFGMTGSPFPILDAGEGGGGGGGGGGGDTGEPGGDPAAGEPGGGDGGGGEPQAFTWRANLPDELQSDPAFAPYPDDVDGLIGLASSYKGVQKFVGAEKIPKPNPDDPETMDVVYKAMGRPDTAEDYSFKFLEEAEWPEGSGPDRDLYKAIAPAIHRAGLNQDQLETIASGLAEYENGRYTAGLEKQNEAHGVCVAELQKEFGQAYDQKVGAAAAVMNRLLDGAADDDRAMITATLGNNAAFVKLMAEVAELTKEDGKLVGDGKRGGGAMTPAEAKREISAIQGNTKHPYFNRDHPGHDEAVAYMQKLHEAAHPAQ